MTFEVKCKNCGSVFYVECSEKDFNKVFIGKRKMVDLLIPLPPVAEQKRIVAKLEEILPLCDRLK